MHRTVVLNVVGLSRKLIGNNTPKLASFINGCIPLTTVSPAVTCPVQATFLTGKTPAEHGIVANGWYFRDLSEILFWRQSNRLICGEKIWHAGKRRNPAFTCANTCWWYNMASDADVSITPRPLYCADGRKIPDCYTIPTDLRAHLTRELGRFPLFKFWGPATSIESSRWIGDASIIVDKTYQPTLHLIYLPHLDYVLQREGPDGAIETDLREIDSLCARLVEYYTGQQCRIIILSEYGITQVQHTIHPNRILREAGYLSLKIDFEREYLDPGASRAFAVSDHQIAHLYIKNREDIASVAALFKQLPGISHVLDEEGKRAFNLSHDRSGELVLISGRDYWFSYYYWTNDSRAPDYARIVDIHAKPGYDPCELFIDPAIRFPKIKIGSTLVKKALHFRSLMDVIPLDCRLVKGSHGRVTDTDDEGPVFMTTEPKLLNETPIRAVDVYQKILDHVFKD